MRVVQLYGYTIDWTRSVFTDILGASMGKKYILPFVGLLSGLIAIFLMVGYKIVPLFSHADVLGIKSIIFTPTPTLPPLKGTILFVSNKNGNYDIYKMNLATLETIPLTSDSSDEMNPQLSPDNSHIVYYSNRDGDNEIYTIDLATNTLTQLTKNTAGDYDPSYSPDGKQIVFKSNRDDGYGDIFIMNANGTGQKNLTPNRKSSEEWIPVFTKDGARIIFVSRSGRDHKSDELYSMNKNGSDIIQITNNNVADWYPSRYGDNQLLFISQDTPNDDDDIYISNLDGSGRIKLTSKPGDNSDPSFSNELKAIVYINNSDGDYDLYYMNPDGSGVRKIIDTPYTELSPIFLPDTPATPIPSVQISK